VTTEEFWSEANRIIRESFLSTLPPAAPGGHVTDNLNVPILEFEDVEVVVTRTAYTMRVSTIRRRVPTTLDDTWPDGVLS
jgi:hypothetical protein